jgi:hypothetical protein
MSAGDCVAKRFFRILKAELTDRIPIFSERHVHMAPGSYLPIFAIDLISQDLYVNFWLFRQIE